MGKSHYSDKLLEYLPLVLNKLNRKVTSDEIFAAIEAEPRFADVSTASINKLLRELAHKAIISIDYSGSGPNLYSLRIDLDQNFCPSNELLQRIQRALKRTKLGMEIKERIPFLETYSYRTINKRNIGKVNHRSHRCRSALDIGRQDFLPAFLGLFIASARSPDRRPCCFVLPDTENVALVTGLVHALSELRDGFGEMAQNYAQNVLKKGQRVFFHPDNGVYEYEGMQMTELGWQFMLKVPGRQESRNCPLELILMLEPTQRKIPRGRIERARNSYRPTPLDKLMDGVTTGGNKSIFTNKVLFLCKSVKTFEEELDRSYFASASYAPPDSAISYLPWGTISRDGKLKHSDARLTAGEPVFAAHSKISYIEKLCRETEKFTRIVFSDTPRKFADNLQAFDTISGAQQLNIFATYRDLKHVGVLKERGCLVWVVHPDEVFLCDCPDDKDFGRAFHEVFNGATVQESCKLETVEVHNQLFMNASKQLSETADYLKSIEDNDSGLLFMRTLYRQLLTLSSLLSLIPEDIAQLRDDLEGTARVISKQRYHLPGQTAQMLLSIIDCITAIYEMFEARGISPKSESIKQALTEVEDSDETGVVLVAPNPTSLRSIRKWCKENSVRVDCQLLADLMNMRNLEKVIVPSWTFQQSWINLRNSFNVREIVCVLYDFEIDWMNLAESRRANVLKEFTLSAEEKEEVTGIGRELFFDSDPLQFEVDGGSKAGSYIDMEQLLSTVRKDKDKNVEHVETKEAKYVSFSGDTYSYLTKTHKAIVLTELIEDPDDADAEIGQKVVSELETGDYLLFRDSTDKSIIREVALTMTDPDIYHKTRADVDLWKEVLKQLGPNASNVYKKLVGNGFKKSYLAVLNWLEDDEMIGPGDRKDLTIIANAARNRELFEKREKVWNSIKAIRQIHQRAGRRLTEILLEEVPALLDAVSDKETKIDLNIGTVWIVRVDQIESTFNQYPSSRVNRLNWTEY